MTWEGGFTNPTVGPAQIQDGSITSIKLATTLQSDNFVTGTSGWQLQRDTGDAEFNDVTVRGTIFATAGEIGDLDIIDDLTIKTGGNILFQRNSNAGISTNDAPVNGDFWITFGAGGSVGRIQGLQKSGGSELVRAELQIISSGFEVAQGEFHIRGGIIDSPLGQDLIFKIAGNNQLSIRTISGGTQFEFDQAADTYIEATRVGTADRMHLHANDSLDFSSSNNSLGMRYVNTGLYVFGVNPYTTQQAWFTLESPSSGGSYDDQVAGISLGESGYKGSAAGHIVYTGDGYTHIGGGSVTNGANPPMAYPVFKIHYNGNRVQHVSGAEAPGWDRYSNSAPGSVRLDSSGTNYRVYQHTSSERFKSNVKEIPAKWAWDFVNMLEPVTYKGKHTKDYYAGLTAENVYAAEQLIKKRSKATFVACDDEGEPDSYGDEGITAMLIKTIQDLKERVEMLEAAA